MFLAVQHAVSQEIIKQKTGKPINTKVYLQRLPQLSYRRDDLLVAMERFISMILMMCFAYTFVNTVRVVTAEKEMQLKVSLLIFYAIASFNKFSEFISFFISLKSSDDLNRL